MIFQYTGSKKNVSNLCHSGHRKNTVYLKTKHHEEYVGKNVIKIHLQIRKGHHIFYDLVVSKLIRLHVNEL